MNVILSGVLQKYALYQREHSLAAETIQEAIAQLVGRFPAMSSVLLDQAGQPRKVHRLFLNGQQIAPEQVGQCVGQGDRLEILTAIAGG
ncbi:MULTISPECIES: MoaD/ThiS family protein [unclassified Burkholderia]|uniref:MoaD/ThiS family protein n=1 Tax=unclassified Burkholderia TaxID=2613784 RepID=UPI00119C03B3|nr:MULTISPECIES: MoaD/ThiS family protein [unclassified Burkholderia]TWC59650.1 ThiS family protein [Burkholderia sp. SJZ089]TWC94627.1 ThiS family protein [Burkholderia sp. SJZ115]TWC96539.1 ThiS family protein [Burkholderia sp. SJZ091]